MRTIFVAGLVWACAVSASAQSQSLKLEFNEGKVSIDATAVPVRSILAEWARLGGTKVVGAERLSGAPLTIHLESVPEAQALEVVLRSVAGYMAAPRQAASIGASAYDRILVMPTSAAPQATTATARPGTTAGNPAGPRGGRGAFSGAPAGNPDAEMPPPPPLPDDADGDVNEPAPFQFPQQNPNPFVGAGQPGAFGQPGAIAQPFGQPGAFGTPVLPGSQPPVISFGQPGSQGVVVNPTPNQPAPVMQFPGMPPVQGNPGGFGTVGSPTPGMIMQPVQPGQAQPGQPVRPPGGD